MKVKSRVVFRVQVRFLLSIQQRWDGEKIVLIADYHSNQCSTTGVKKAGAVLFVGWCI